MIIHGFHSLPYISGELPYPWPHSLRALLPCMRSPSKTALSLNKCPLLHNNTVDLVKVDPIFMLQPLFTHKGA